MHALLSALVPVAMVCSADAPRNDNPVETERLLQSRERDLDEAQKSGCATCNVIVRAASRRMAQSNDRAPCSGFVHRLKNVPSRPPPFVMISLKSPSPSASSSALRMVSCWGAFCSMAERSLLSMSPSCESFTPRPRSSPHTRTPPFSYEEGGVRRWARLRARGAPRAIARVARRRSGISAARPATRRRSRTGSPSASASASLPASRRTRR